MDRTNLLQELKMLLKERFPGHYNYTHMLAETLGIHEKTLLSKLRGTTPFTMDELYIISNHLDIPVGNLFSKTNRPGKYPMNIYVYDFTADYRSQLMTNKLLDAYQLAASSKHSTYMVASNTLPDFIYIKYQWIAKFTYVKWLYYNKNREDVLHISDIQLTLEDEEVNQKYFRNIISFKRSIYILHINMMQYIVEDIIFFYNIDLIDKKEIVLLVEDYHKLLNDFEDVCNDKSHLSAGKEILIFFSDILLSNDITVIESDELNFAIIYAYFRNPIVSQDKDAFRIIRQWFYSWLNSANIISVSDQLKRVEFFRKQREHLAGLEKSLQL